MRVFNGEKICYYEEDCETGEYISRPLHDMLESLQNLPHFVDSKNGDNAQNWIWKNWQCDQATRLMVFSFQCTMEAEHRLDYIVITANNKMMKIGQFPSVADLTFPELKKYKKELSKEDMSELKRAIGLYAQGIGVGSYVYLRRIFERIINKAKNMAIIDQKIEESEYIKAHVDERIKMLKDYLPDTMVKSTAFYGIVSKGIHELTEKECVEYFPILQEYIFMILRQWGEVRNKQEAENRIQECLAKITAEVRQNHS